MVLFPIGLSSRQWYSLLVSICLPSDDSLADLLVLGWPRASRSVSWLSLMNMVSLCQRSTGVEQEVGEDGPALEFVEDDKLWAGNERKKHGENRSGFWKNSYKRREKKIRSYPCDILCLHCTCNLWLTQPLFCSWV